MISPHSDIQREAKALLLQFDEETVRWTPKHTLELMIANPASEAIHFQHEIDDAKKLVPSLTEQPITFREEARDNKSYLVISGEGAADVAAIMKGELSINFPGSASLPAAIAKT